MDSTRRDARMRMEVEQGRANRDLVQGKGSEGKELKERGKEWGDAGEGRKK